MGKASERLAAVRELLRHLDHPQRLCDNPLIKGRFSGVFDAARAAEVGRALDLAIETLPQRRREIIRRCDLAGERHPLVMRDLGVSERHFYRERRRALESIADEFLSPPRAAVSDGPVRRLDERLALEFGFAETARQAGHLPRAIDVLSDASRRADDGHRSEIQCRLAELLSEAGSLEGALDQLDRARAAFGGPNLPAEAVYAAVSWRLGHVEQATISADRAIHGLQREPRNQWKAAKTRALAIALLVQSEIDVAQGRWRSGRRRALDARNAITIPGVDFEALKARADLAATFAYMFEPGHLDNAVVELEAQYRKAVATGLTLEAILVRLHLCAVYRFRGEPLKAAKAIEEVFPVAKIILSAEQYVVVCLELANSYVLCRDASKAHAALNEARSCLPIGLNLSPFIDLLSAKAFLLDGLLERTLELSVSASEAMTQLGIVTSIGESMRIQAEARYALGDERSAKDLVVGAIACLDHGGHPFTMAKAQQSAGRITGNRKYYRSAREIFAVLRSS